MEDLDHLVQSCAWDLRTTVLSNMPYAPDTLAFGMNMI